MGLQVRDGLSQARANLEDTKKRVKASEARIDADLEPFINKAYWSVISAGSRRAGRAGAGLATALRAGRAPTGTAQGKAKTDKALMRDADCPDGVGRHDFRRFPTDAIRPYLTLGHGGPQAQRSLDRQIYNVIEIHYNDLETGRNQ